MKRIGYIVFLILIALAASQLVYATEKTVNVKLAWDQAVDDLPYLAKWKVYWSESADGQFEFTGLEITNEYDPNNPTAEHFANIGLVIAGDRGETVRKWFTLSAVGNDGLETAQSLPTPEPLEVTIPVDITVPQSVTVRIIVTTGGN